LKLGKISRGDSKISRGDFGISVITKGGTRRCPLIVEQRTDTAIPLGGLVISSLQKYELFLKHGKISRGDSKISRGEIPKSRGEIPKSRGDFSKSRGEISGSRHG
jgi:hypothetical protein